MISRQFASIILQLCHPVKHIHLETSVNQFEVLFCQVYSLFRKSHLVVRTYIPIVDHLQKHRHFELNRKMYLLCMCMLLVGVLIVGKYGTIDLSHHHGLQGGSRISCRRGRQHTNFPKNCMKLIKFWSVGGTRAGAPPLGSATG